MDGFEEVERWEGRVRRFLIGKGSSCEHELVLKAGVVRLIVENYAVFSLWPLFPSPKLWNCILIGNGLKSRQRRRHTLRYLLRHFPRHFSLDTRPLALLSKYKTKPIPIHLTSVPRPSIVYTLLPLIRDRRLHTRRLPRCRCRRVES